MSTVTKILEALRIYKNGKVDVGRIIITGGLFGAFVLWRIFTFGVYGSDALMSSIEEDIIADYRQAVYTKYGLYEKDPDALALSRRSAEYTSETAELKYLDVQFTNISMAASLMRFGAQETVIVRFDYVLKADGITKESNTGVYKMVSRKGIDVIYDSDAFSYYINYL
jgi:hypothetical protein